MNFSQMLNDLLTIEGMIGLVTLSILEIVLGIDNIIFISITADRLPKAQKPKARSIGLILALVTRIALLFSINWIVGLKEPWFHLGSIGITGRDVILLSGGIFLVYKTILELKAKISGEDEENNSHSSKKKATMLNVIFQIVLIDIVFSFDSILTAVAISNNIILMSSAVIISMIIMIIFSGYVSEFINQNPRIKMLALAFLLIIGFVLITEALKEVFGLKEISKSYIYAALGFSLFVEILNLWEKKIRKKKLREHEISEKIEIKTFDPEKIKN